MGRDGVVHPSLFQSFTLTKPKTLFSALTGPLEPNLLERKITEAWVFSFLFIFLAFGAFLYLRVEVERVHLYIAKNAYFTWCQTCRDFVVGGFFFGYLVSILPEIEVSFVSFTLVNAVQTQTEIFDRWKIVPGICWIK